MMVPSYDPAATCRTPQLYAALYGRPIETLVAIARDFSPRLERYGEADVVLDVSGLGRLLGDARAIAVELARAGAGRVAVCRSQIGARLLVRAREGVTVVPAADGDVRDAGECALAKALSTVPLDVLRQLVADIDRNSPFDVLRRWGLKTLGEFAALPAADLSSRIGQHGLALQRLARGLDPRPLVPDPGVVRFVQSMEFEWPIEALEPLSFVFARLLDPLAAALEAADRGAAAIRLDLRLTDRHTHSRLLQLPVAMRDARVLRTLLLLDLESHPPSAAIDVVTIEADPAPARIIQYSLLERALPSAETLATLNARLGALVGTDRCGSPTLVDSYRPDAFVMNVFGTSQFPPPSREALRRGHAEACRSEQARQAEAGSSPVPQLSLLSALGAPPPSALARRLRASSFGRLMTTLSSVEGSLGPQALPQLRRFRPPVAIRVSIERGRPVRVAIDRRGMPGGKVLQAAGPWRTSGAWWEGKPWNRDEWDVAVADGAACRIFRDREGGVWFLEGVFD
jgi:protein ImuB